MSFLERTVIVLTLRTGGLAETKGSHLQFLRCSCAPERQLVWVQLRVRLLEALNRLARSPALACADAGSNHRWEACPRNCSMSSLLLRTVTQSGPGYKVIGLQTLRFLARQRPSLRRLRYSLVRAQAVVRVSSELEA
jgi:hypothetical protein